MVILCFTEDLLLWMCEAASWSMASPSRSGLMLSTQREPDNKSVSDTTCLTGMKGDFILFLGLTLSPNHMYQHFLFKPFLGWCSHSCLSKWLAWCRCCSGSQTATNKGNDEGAQHCNYSVSAGFKNSWDNEQCSFHLQQNKTSRNFLINGFYPQKRQKKSKHFL